MPQLETVVHSRRPLAGQIVSNCDFLKGKECWPSFVTIFRWCVLYVCC